MGQNTTLNRFKVLEIPFRTEFYNAARRLDVFHVPPVSFTAVHAAFLDPFFKAVLG